MESEKLSLETSYSYGFLTLLDGYLMFSCLFFKLSLIPGELIPGIHEFLLGRTLILSSIPKYMWCQNLDFNQVTSG